MWTERVSKNLSKLKHLELEGILLPHTNFMDEQIKSWRLKALLKVIKLIYKDDESIRDITYKQCGSFVYLFILSTNMNWSPILCQTLCPVLYCVPFNVSDTEGILTFSFLLVCSIAVPGLDMRKARLISIVFRDSHHFCSPCNDTIQQAGYHNEYNISI